MDKHTSLKVLVDSMESANDSFALPDIPADFNWNVSPHPGSPFPETLPAEPTPQQVANVELLSECLRDGLHGVSIYPALENIMQYAETLYKFGIKHAAVGIFPGEDSAISTNTKLLLTRLRDTLPGLTPYVLCLCTPASLKWTVECKQIHPALTAYVFMGSAPSRRLAQGWNLDFLLKSLSHFTKEAVRLGVSVVGATEHTTQTPPHELHQLISAQASEGIQRFIIADTIGTARPRGAYRIVHFVRRALDEIGARDVKIDWHGHRDIGHGLSNALMAIAAGANCIHVVSRGIGERAGNVPLEELVLNLTAILGEAGQSSKWQMPELLHLLSLYEKLVNVAAPQYGVLARRYNHTTLGIHTDAILKINSLAEKAAHLQQYEVAERLHNMTRTLYSGVDLQALGDTFSVGVSHWSGQSSVRLAYLCSGGDPQSLSDATIEQVLTTAKALGRELEPSELSRFFSNTSVNVSAR